MQSIVLKQEVPAPPERVWEVYTHHKGWPEWAGIREAVLRCPGHPVPDGVGAIRVFRAKGMAIEEEITVFEPPRRMEYRLTAGAPLKNHRGEVVLEPGANGTVVTWRVDFEPLIPLTGWLVARLLTANLTDVLERLARYPFSASAAVPEPTATSGA